MSAAVDYGTLLVVDDAGALARTPAKSICAWAMEIPGTVQICLSGGATPWRTYQELASARLVDRFPWQRVHWFRRDGRFVPPDDPASNFRTAELQRAYGCASLTPARPLFHICLLGPGNDGHTASLLPGEPALNERWRWVAAVAHGRPETRITLTYPAIYASRHIAFLVSGADKRAILSQVLSGRSHVPAARLDPRRFGIHGRPRCRGRMTRRRGTRGVSQQ